jgi:hypothetical protein
MAAINRSRCVGADPAGRWAAATWYSNGGGSFGTTGDITDSDSLIDPTFSVHSYGFRPGRSAHQAVPEAAYVAEGRRIVVDIDLAKFFDRVNHDILMAASSAACGG